MTSAVFFRDDGLSNSQAHIALKDQVSLFHEDEEHLDGISLFCQLFCPSSFQVVHELTVLSFLCVDPDSDSDSDLSIEDDQSGSYASTHSSDSEDDEGALPPEECWENLASNVAKKGIEKNDQMEKKP